MTPSFLYLAKNYRRWFSLLALMSIMLAGCYMPCGYQVVRPDPASYGTHAIMRLSQAHHFIVLHKGDSAWQLINYHLNRDDSSISGTLKELPSKKINYEVSDTKAGNHTVEGRTSPFDEVHVRVSKMEMDSAGEVLILKEEIKDIQIYEIQYKVNRAVVIPVIAAGAAATTGFVIVFILVIVNGLHNMTMDL